MSRSSPRFTLEVLPADYGDCLIVEYGSGADLHRVVVDGGPTTTWPRLRDRLGKGCHMDLLVVTHIDTDHICGILELLRDTALGTQVDEVWFNSFDLLPADMLGPKQGEQLSTLIRDWRRRSGTRWNTSVGGEAVMVPDSGDLPRATLPGGLVLTVLSPDKARLARLRPVWKKVVKDAGLVKDVEAVPEPGVAPDALGGLGGTDVDTLVRQRFVEDTAVPNGSSIALLAEFGGSACLLGADAYPSVVGASLRRLAAERGVPRITVDTVKVPHHGSRSNLGKPLLDAVDARRWVFSSNGDKFQHPDSESVARVIKASASPLLCFNYATKRTTPWDDADLKRRHGYRTLYPAAETSGLLIDLLSR